jgi:hypothetical protein
MINWRTVRFLKGDYRIQQHVEVKTEAGFWNWLFPTRKFWSLDYCVDGTWIPVSCGTKSRCLCTYMDLRDDDLLR